MTPMQRAEEWVRDDSCRGMSTELHGSWAGWLVTLWHHGGKNCIRYHGGGTTQEAAAAWALRQAGITDFEEATDVQLDPGLG